MVSKFWRKFVAIYFAIGIFWGVFATFKGFDIGLYNEKNTSVMMVTFFVNTFVWPASLPIGLIRLITE